MRILKPEVVKDREEKILRMIIQEFVENRKPVGSELVAQKGLKGVSSATIRNIMNITAHTTIIPLLILLTILA